MATNKSPFPSWLPFITIPLIFIVSRNINYNRRVPTQRYIPQQPPNQVDVLSETCRQCKIIGDCSAFPFCTTSKTTCEWEQNWDGKWIQKCRNY